MQFYMPTKVYSQPDCVASHASELAAFGKSAMIVTGRSSAKKCGALQDVTAALESKGCGFVIFDRVEENPSIETVMQAREEAVREGVDFFVAIGGGSPMDAAKAISLMTANPGEDESVFYTAKALPYLPVVCVPTTCGTGSEVTPYAILTRHALRTKKSISHKIFPALALLDAKYLASMPRNGLVNTCIDALAHLLESYLNTNTNALNRICSREGLLVWGRFMDRLLTDGLVEQDYWDMLHASMIAGMAITHTGTSLPHGMSYCVTYEKGIPHGRAVGMFLGGFVKGYPDREEAAEAVKLLGFADTDAFCRFVGAVLGTVDVPQDLLRQGAAMLLSDPGKLKNYPFAVTEDALVAMANAHER